MPIAPFTLRVMTYNIRWGLGADGRYRLDRIAAVIQESGADLIGLQEIERGSPRSHFRDQPARLARLLGMEVAFGPNLRLGTWDFGNALLSRLPIRRWRNVPLPVPSDHSPLFSARNREETPWVAPRAGASAPSIPRSPRFSATALLRRWTPGLFDRRGVLVAEIGEGGDGPEPDLTVLVTHLPLRREVRLAQAGEILALLPDAAPALVIGDFNERPDGAAMRRFRAGGLENLSGVEPTFPSTRPLGKIDYVLGAGHVKGVGARVVASTASDHLPVVVDVEVNSTTPLALGEETPARVRR